MAKCVGNHPDVLHSYYALAGLSLRGWRLLQVFVNRNARVSDIGTVYLIRIYLVVLSSVAIILIAQPCFEKYQSPKTADAIWMPVMAAIGYKTLDGTLNKWVAAALWLGNGAQFWLAPKSGIDLYEMKGVSKLGESLMSLWGGQALCVGTYLAALIKGKSESEAFAYAMAVNGLAAAKFAFVEADDLNVPKAGPLAWTALSGALAYKALN